MSWLSRFGRSSGCVAVELNAEYISCAVRGGESLQLSHISSMRCEQGRDSYTDILQAFVDKVELQGRRCRFVLGAQDYQLLLVEAPDVPESELREALKWRVKDLISGDLQDSVIDVFQLPSGVSRSGKTMVYVVVAELALVKSLIQLSKDVDLELESIDIEVLAMRNLLQLKQLERGAAVVRLRAGSGDVSIYHDGDLYLSRQFKLNYSGGLLDELPSEQLALEVQRSLDYFERQMGQAPPGVVYVCGEGVGPEKICQELQRALSLPVEFLDLMVELGLTDHVDEGLLQLCLGAAGGALRGEGA